MVAEIISVGTELLIGQITDTHAPTMARILAECGISCRHRSTVGDNLDRLVETLKTGLQRSDVIVTIGGLGPTTDDLTRDAIALALDDTLELVPEIEAKLRHFFESRGYSYVESNSRQAMKPTCADTIPNPNGTAPGLVCRKNNKTVFALPGPKGEFDPMAYDSVKPMLETLGGGDTIHSRTLRIIGVGESHVEAILADMMNQENPTVAPYAQTGEVHLRLTAKAKTAAEAEAIIAPTEAKIKRLLGNAVYGVNLETLEDSIINLLIQKGETVSTAESMTGGGIGERLTSVPGSSKAYKGGFVTYTPEAKMSMLDLSPELISGHGPVSIQVAEAMSRSVRQKLNTTFGIAIVGNAGPTSDIDGKPVGLVIVSISGPHGTTSDTSNFRGIREDIRKRGEQTALRLLRAQVLES